MNKKIIIGICIGIIIVVIGLFAWFELNTAFDKSNPIIFEKSETEDYTCIIYQDREYVPYCAFSPEEREKYLGYVNEDKKDEIYTVKGYSEEEWLINYLDSGMMNDCMLYKEKNVTNIPEGVFSEYEWNKLSDLDKFYSNKATKEYKDIRELGEDYNTEQAQLDNCFIIGAMVHNDYLYTEFMDKYKNKETAFIRVAQNTVEGNLCLIDILYDSENNKIYLVTDNTRDGFSTNEDRTIKIREYEQTGEWKYAGNLYWIAYNGEIEESSSEEYSFNSEQLYIIATIN